jgi:hypothetical protein
MTPRITVYQAMDFLLPATRLTDVGAPRSLVGTGVSAWLGTDQFQLPVDIVVTQALAGEYAFSRPRAVTATWPIGVWALYVEYVDAGLATPELACLLDVRVAG